MTNLIKNIKRSVFLIVFSIFVFEPVFSQEEHEGDWFSLESLSSVVKLSSLLVTYDVEGLESDYKYRTKGGDPDFGDANVVSAEARLVHVGTGVVITKGGLIISNAHVTRAYIKPSIKKLQGDKVGPNGKPITRVTINPVDNVMFVGVPEMARLDKGDDSQKLKYVAYILTDDENFDTNRDRAVLQIISACHLNDEGLPKTDGKVSDLNLPFAKFGNPFRTSFVDRKVRAMGFPGTGDPNRSARTAGELLGYESEEKSKLLHTSYISGGNSCGGLFHKDMLIGINTWDSLKNQSRPVAKAQPITYWFDILTKAKWLYPTIVLPDGMKISWINDDPGKESYKDEVQVLLKFVLESNSNIPVTSGKVYVHREDTSINDVLKYLSVEKDLNNAWFIANLLQYYTIEDVAKELDLSEIYVKTFQSITDRKQLKDLIPDKLYPYFDEWYNGTFFCKCVEINDEDGKTAVSVPKNSKTNITYVSEDGKNAKTFTCTSNSYYLLGSYTLPVSQ